MNGYGEKQFAAGSPELELYNAMVAEYRAASGMEELGAAVQVQIADFVRLENLKGLAMKDVAERGLGKKESNGRQSYWKDNRSAALVPKYMDQQMKILKKLGLGGVESPDTESDSSATDDFDDI